MPNRVFIATPTAGGTVTTSFATTLVAATVVCNKAGWTYRQAFFDGPYVATARNLFANVFLADAECTHLLFIDSDMLVGMDVLSHLLECAKPMAGVIYTERALDLDRLIEAARDGATRERALAVAAHFETSLPKGPVKFENGFCKVETLGFGCVMIEKQVLQAMIDKSVVGKIKSDKLARYGVGEEIYDFFSDLDLGGGQRLSEDYSFCHRARDAGFDIWGYGMSAIGHVGAFVYGAPFIEKVRAAAEKAGVSEKRK